MGGIWINIWQFFLTRLLTKMLLQKSFYPTSDFLKISKIGLVVQSLESVHSG